MSDWPILHALGDDERRAVLAAARRRRFTRGEVIFHEGDPGDSIHLVAKGHVGIRIHTPLGDTAMVRVVGRGDFFGELAAVSPGPRNATAQCLSQAETVMLSREQLSALQAQHPEVDRILIAALAAEVRRLAAQVVELAYVPAERRVWRQLVTLCDVFAGDDDGGGAVVPLTQEELAEIVGCTRPTVNQVLRGGENEGIISLTRGRIRVEDRALLERKAR